MGDRYEIEGRVVEWRAGMVVRDESRHATAGSIDAATAVARSFVDDGMVTWVFAVRWERGRVAPTYHTVEHLNPTEPRPSGRPNAGGSSPRMRVA